MASAAILLYHGSVFIWYFFLTYSLLTVTATEQPAGVFLYGGQWKYLTVLNVFVFLSFWALYSYDRQLVYPEGLDKVIPQWLNHAVHSAVFPIAVLEIVTSPHHYPPRRKGLILLGICSISYISWVIWIYLADGNWVYPFLGLLSPFGFLIFLLCSHILAVFVYIVGETLNYILWGEVQNKKMKI
ncbi:androgen-dependent TFPI-regulating protein isoform 2-T2 [Anomaloglossus baeobatrachus]|uniref:androgen-dependent TFPI-regulating protein isoform X2 n=1 Tax=Anomaloglossus baeobatrachus TaxID=238106 RepID=UPI003F4FCAFE